MNVSDISIASVRSDFPNGLGASERKALVCSGNWETASKIIALKAASYLTDPICKVREYFYTFYTLNEICETTVQKVMQAACLVLGMGACTLLAPFTAPIGAMLRGVVASLESKPYIYLAKAKEGKVLPEDKKITLVSHNQCYMPAGYCITDGQVMPSSDRERMNGNIAMVKALDPDIICLYEVPDICDAWYLSSQFPEYPFIIPVAGVRAVGPSSMMYVASKYEIEEQSIEFVPFVKGTELTGRAQFSEKGFLSFDVKSRGEKTPFATVVSTHLQHSEVPAEPEDSDKIARAMQMNKIAKQIEKKVGQGRNVIFTGDLNQEEKELHAFFDAYRIDWLRRDASVRGQSTWGGDLWCSKLMDKPSSGPLVLDYTLIAGKTVGISTKVIGTGYCGLQFKRDATSDHDLLFNTIELG